VGRTSISPRLPSIIDTISRARCRRAVRGAAPADLRALENVVLRVGALVDAHPEIAELDCNPIVVLGRGVAVVDARIRVEMPSRRPRCLPGGPRRG
jgi:hypothetical protein